MDNLTHSLIAVFVADATLTLRRLGGAKIERHAAVAAIFSSIVANNIPDIDFVLTPLTGGSLGYLLHHRGHTHTIAATPLMAGVTLALVWSWLRLTRRSLPRHEWLWLALFAVVGQLLHLTCDWWNNYGVHPFWPLDDSWYYLDAIFIIEPWLWLSLLPVVAAGAQLTVVRALCHAAAGAALALAVATGFVPHAIVLALAVYAVAMALLARRLGDLRLVLGGAAIAAVLFVFIRVSHEVEAQYASWRRAVFPRATLHEVALAPFPGNPFCWSLTAIETEAERYLTRRGVWAPFPGVLGAADCPALFHPDPRTHTAVPAPSTPHAVWLGQTDQALPRLRQLATHHCGVAAFLQFARAPHLREEDGELVLNDLRYERDGLEGFWTARFPSDMQECPRNRPPWLPPRLDVLQ
jgi:inner membrane protein